MTVAGSISEADFARLNWTLFYRRPPIALLLVAALALGLFFSTREGLEGATLLLPWSPLVLALGLYGMVTHNARRKFRASRMLQSRVSYTLAADGIAVTSPDGQAVLPWAQLTSWQDLPRHLLLHSTKGQAFLVGKAWFDSHDAMLRFTQTLDRRSLAEPPPAADA